MSSPFYRGSSSSPGPSHAVSNDGCDGANKVLENLTGLMGATDQQSALAAAKLFQAASEGGTAALTRASAAPMSVMARNAAPMAGLDKVLPACHISGSPVGGEAFHALADSLSKMADPCGFMNIIMEILKLAMNGGSELLTSGVGNAVETYGQAAEAAFEDMLKNKAA